MRRNRNEMKIAAHLGLPRTATAQEILATLERRPLRTAAGTAAAPPGPSPIERVLASIPGGRASAAAPSAPTPRSGAARVIASIGPARPSGGRKVNRR